MIRRNFTNKQIEKLKSLEALRKKPDAQITMDDIKKIVIYLAHKEKILT